MHATSPVFWRHPTCIDYYAVTLAVSRIDVCVLHIMDPGSSKTLICMSICQRLFAETPKITGTLSKEQGWCSHHYTSWLIFFKAPGNIFGSPTVT